MKMRSILLSATQRSEFENLKKVREMFEQARKPKNAEIYTSYRHTPSQPRTQGLSLGKDPGPVNSNETATLRGAEILKPGL